MPVTLTKAEARKRLIKRSDMVAEKVAFIDCKMPGSHLKENYALIGPGVTQSTKQRVNLAEPHGFSLGIAAMPAGITNNLHLHYTAETFMVFTGTWKFRWGDHGRDGEINGGPGDRSRCRPGFSGVSPMLMTPTAGFSPHWARTRPAASCGIPRS